MLYEYNNKKIQIPDATIDNFINNLGISKAEAIQMYLEDEGYIKNAEVEELTAKAKENKVMNKVCNARKPAGPRERKENPEKREIILTLFNDVISDCYDDAIIKNPEREITFRCGDNDYSITLIQHRKNKGE